MPMGAQLYVRLHICAAFVASADGLCVGVHVGGVFNSIQSAAGRQFA
jgi:hypothetical protein